MSAASAPVPQPATCGDLTIFPPVLDFFDVQPGALCTGTLRIQNSGTRARRIRVAPPAAGSFSLAYNLETALAPGIEMPCEVAFIAPPATAAAVGSGAAKPDTPFFSDTLVVRAEGGAVVRIPVRSYRPIARLEAPPVVDFGHLLVGKLATREVTVTNASTVCAAEVEFVLTAVHHDAVGKVRVAPSRVSLAPATPEEVAAGANAGTFTVEIDTFGLDEGPLELKGELRPVGGAAGGSPFVPVPVTVAANVVEHIVAIKHAVGDKGQVHLSTPVDVGTLFYGEAASVTLLLENDGPSPVEFNFASRDGVPSGAAAGSHASDDGASISTHGSVMTAHGAIAAAKEKAEFTSASINAAVSRITALRNPPLASAPPSRADSRGRVDANMATVRGVINGPLAGPAAKPGGGVGTAGAVRGGACCSSCCR